MSGKTSFLISFAYDPKVVDAIKTLQVKQYIKKIQAWEIPSDCLAEALDTLTFLDTIQLILLPETEEISNQGDFNLTQAEIDQLHFKPYKHQVEGINYGLQKKKWLLLDNPGCGKTNQIIGLAETLKHRGLVEHCLVIAGINSLKSNWAKEIKKFSNEKSIIIGEKLKRDGTVSKIPMSIAERVEQLKKPISEFFVILNVESLRDDRIVSAISSGPNKFQMIAIDEVHKCLATGKSSTQGSNILKLKADFQVAASGTILLNNPGNCWGPLAWIDVDHSTWGNFKSQYMKFGGFGDKQVVGYKNLDTLKEELESCSIRRSKEQLVDLPPKTITVELLDMLPEHQKFYDAVKDGVKSEVDKVKLTTGNLLALTTRLRQATVDPWILTTSNIVSTKIERCCELVEELMDSKEKVVILSSFKPPVYKLAEALKQYNPVICTGDQADTDVSKAVDAFQNDDEHMILIGTLGKVSTGLTLNRASYMIMLDEHWTSAMNNQAHDRIYRLNNTTPAFITILACKDTIDERVHEVSQYKQDLSDFVIDDIENSLSDSLRSAMTDILMKL